MSVWKLSRPVAVTKQLCHYTRSAEFEFAQGLLKVRKSELINERDDGVESDTRDQSEVKQRLKRSPQNREFQEEDDVEDISRGDRKPKGRRRGGGRDDATVRPGPRMTNPSHSVALHLDGDASNYSMGHRHYEGNGRIRHMEGIFKDWRLKDWAIRFGRHFQLDQTVGTVNVRESGIYFVYAQVHYSDNHDVNGFRILVNNVAVLQCTVTSHGGAHLKSNTCYTGGLVELRTGDNLSVRDLAALRYSIFEAGKSFFGLFRVSHLPTAPREGI
ncbi:hypothetical protein J437_LFUL011351 [Ladona fulva]|uniref:THD domain-containing protein n=1 Tax=Ladona fulva TaxID=123851 RepID=A0A8K0KAI6_LADFU|nr:hypothetical protein J437_LFUL011351 [Ladona fulva]